MSALERWGMELPEASRITVEELETACLAALAGGQAALRFYGEDSLAIRDKDAGEGAVQPPSHAGETGPSEPPANNPVTAADDAANEAILEILANRSDEPVLSEESRPPDRRSTGGRLWVVDPLDGTKEFIARNGEFSIMVGLAESGHARLGAVYLPSQDKLFAGVIGDGDGDRGAWVVADPLQNGRGRDLDVSGPVAGPVRLVRSRSHGDRKIDDLIERIPEARTLISGSVGVKCALVAQDEADLYVHPVPYLKEWDTCAPEALLRGAGGRVTDCAGEALLYGKPTPAQEAGIFCARRDLYDRVAPIVREFASR